MQTTPATELYAAQTEQFSFKASVSGSMNSSPAGTFDSLLNSLWNSSGQSADPAVETVRDSAKSPTSTLMDMVKTAARKAITAMEQICESLGIGGSGVYGASFTAECSSMQQALVSPAGNGEGEALTKELSESPQFVQSLYAVRIQCTLVQCLDASPAFQKAYTENPEAVMEEFTKRLDELQANFKADVKMGKVVSAEPEDIKLIVDDLDKKFKTSGRQKLIENDREYLEKRGEFYRDQEWRQRGMDEV